MLGDVSGKGLKAAMAVSMIVGAVRTLAEITSQPAEILAGLNRRLVRPPAGRLCHLRCAAPGRRRRCTLASAGHPAPFVNDEELEFPGRAAAGHFAQGVFEEAGSS